MSHYTTFEERLEIESGLRGGLSFGEVAKQVGKNRSTISREVRKYAVCEKLGSAAITYNACRSRVDCIKRHICTSECRKPSVKNCKLCGFCNDVCPDFEEQVCVSRFKPPYVCNGCEERSHCSLEKTMYHATEAQKKAEKGISGSRRGV